MLPQNEHKSIADNKKYKYKYLYQAPALSPEDRIALQNVFEQLKNEVNQVLQSNVNISSKFLEMKKSNKFK